MRNYGNKDMEANKEKIRNVEVLRIRGEDRRISATITKDKKNWIGHSLNKENSTAKVFKEGMVKEKEKEEREEYKL